MKTLRILIVNVIMFFSSQANMVSQSTSSPWPLDSCISYALQKNITIRKSVLTQDSKLVSLEQSKSSMFPSVSAYANQNFSWAKEADPITMDYGAYSSSKSTSVGINSSIVLFNGFKRENTIRRSQLSYEGSKYDSETIKETITLNVLNAYLQVLYAQEQVKNSEKQIESTTGQLALAEERLKLGGISKSDYLLVKSELSSEQLTLANAQNLLVNTKVTLMQLMELPVKSDFTVESPNLDKFMYQVGNLKSDSIYNYALTIKPQIKSAEISRQMAEMDVSVAKASYLPVLSLNAGLSTGYMSGSTNSFAYQFENKVTPTIGLSLSIPIFQNRQARAGVDIAKINSSNAELDAINTRNQLRKDIEQANTDVIAAEKKYNASIEQYNSVQESNSVATEKYNQGLINSVDFIIQKTNLINAESQLLQSKYNLVFSNKILDFYLGKPLSF